MRAIAVAAAAAALTVAAAACGSTAQDKAGGQRGGGKPLVLTLEQSDPDYSGAQFAAAVAGRSDGSIRIDVSPTWHRDQLDFERGIVEDVRAGKADLGVIGVRVLDTLGVTSFQALIAPFLVDNLELEGRVLESPLAARMLADVNRADVVGIAALPGPLRRPFGYRRALVHRRDYRGFRIGVYPGLVETDTLRSLGATTRDYLNLGGASREGAILNFWAIAGDVGYRGKTVATNVVFWPRPEVVVMNQKAFATLTPAQQSLLRNAGRDAVDPRLAEVRRLENDAVAAVCDQKLAALVTVSPVDVSALHAAVRPVYAELERRPLTKALITAIRKLQRQSPGGAADEPRCGASTEAAASKVEGAWKSSATHDALIAHGASNAEAATYEGSGTLELKRGRWVFRGDRTTVTGTYVIEGDVIRLTMRTCTANPCSPGAITDYVWSVYRDTLSLAPHGEGRSWSRLVVEPSRRVGS